MFGRPSQRTPWWCRVVVLATWGFIPLSTWGADLHSRLATGEIIFHSVKVSGSSARRGEVTGVINAPPEKVWQVITDANQFQEFMPITIKSRLVRPDELKIIQEKQPTTTADVEALLGPTPPDQAFFRVPGQKYTGSFYGLMDVPFPLGDRWYLVTVLWNETQAARQIYTASWSFLTGNLRDYSGEWKVEPFGDHKTRLTYRVVTDTGGFVPKFIVKQFTDTTLPQVITAVRRRVSHHH